ncbi:hypothetical protein EDB19DRAFT_1903971 [Suillus lakei]|nr:hypothetical protein EDB19DRAFT_1903971 [Suillus lakei]
MTQVHQGPYLSSKSEPQGSAHLHLIQSNAHTQFIIEMTDYQPGDKVRYKPIGGATSKVNETIGEIVNVKGSGADAQYTIKNDNTGKRTTYRAGNIEGKVSE